MVCQIDGAFQENAEGLGPPAVPVCQPRCVRQGCISQSQPSLRAVSPRAQLPCSLPAPQAVCLSLAVCWVVGQGRLGAAGKWAEGSGQRQGWWPAQALWGCQGHGAVAAAAADRVLWACSAAAAMWRLLVSKPEAAERVLQELLSVLEDWPLHKIFTSDGDDTDVFSLAVSFWPRPRAPPGLGSPLRARGGEPSPSPSTPRPCPPPGCTGTARQGYGWQGPAQLHWGALRCGSALGHGALREALCAQPRSPVWVAFPPPLPLHLA